MLRLAKSGLVGMCSALALVGGAATGASGLQAASSTRIGPVTVVSHKGTISAPEVMTSGDGRVIVEIWIRGSSGQGQLWSRCGRRRGKTIYWGDPSRVAKDVDVNDDNTDALEVTKDGSEVTAVWNAVYGGHIAVGTASAEVSGNRLEWGTESLLNSRDEQIANASSVQASRDGRVILVVYSSKQGLVARTLANNGGNSTWGPAFVVLPVRRNPVEFNASIAADGNRAVLTWVFIKDGDTTKATPTLVALSIHDGQVAALGRVENLAKQGNITRPVVGLSPAGSVGLVSWSKGEKCRARVVNLRGSSVTISSPQMAGRPKPRSREFQFIPTNIRVSASGAYALLTAGTGPDLRARTVRLSSPTRFGSASLIFNTPRTRSNQLEDEELFTAGSDIYELIVISKPNDHKYQYYLVPGTWRGNKVHWSRTKLLTKQIVNGAWYASAAVRGEVAATWVGSRGALDTRLALLG